MTKDEALKLALQQIEVAVEYIDYLGGESAMYRAALVGLKKALAHPITQAVPQIPQEHSSSEHTGCVCRWDAEGDRVVTCERHQGWLEVVAEWADRAREAEKKVKALAQPAQEPVAWQLTFRDEYDNPRREVLYSKKHLDSHVEHNTNVRGLICVVTPFYTSPPKCQPLTDAQIWQLVNDCSFNRDLHADKFAQAIEAAHGIGSKP